MGSCATAKNASSGQDLSDDAKAVLSSLFSMGRCTVLTYRMVEVRPTAHMQGVLDELVAAKVLRRQPLTGGGVSYVPLVDTSEFRGWCAKHPHAGLFQMSEKVAA